MGPFKRKAGNEKKGKEMKGNGFLVEDPGAYLKLWDNIRLKRASTSIDVEEKLGSGPMLHKEERMNVINISSNNIHAHLRYIMVYRYSSNRAVVKTINAIVYTFILHIYNIDIIYSLLEGLSTEEAASIIFSSVSNTMCTVATTLYAITSISRYHSNQIKGKQVN